MLFFFLNTEMLLSVLLRVIEAGQESNTEKGLSWIWKKIIVIFLEIFMANYCYLQ